MTSLVKFERKVRQSGGSLAITVPPELLKAADMKEGDNVVLFLTEDKKIVIEKA